MIYSINIIYIYGGTPTDEDDFNCCGLLFTSKKSSRCEVALTFAVQESGVAKSGRYYLMCEHQCSGCGRCFNAASSIHLHSPCHLVNLGHLDACSGLDADQRPGAPVRSDYHFLRTAFGGGVSTKDLTWSDLEWTVSVKLCTREILSTS